jgi:hypothetical protein
MAANLYAIGSVAGIGFGAALSYLGFRELKTKRILQDTPTSKIATGAVGGNVEISGKILYSGDKFHVAPISGRLCPFFAVKVQKFSGRKGMFSSPDSPFRDEMSDNEWTTVGNLYSDDHFLVNDGSGANALVYVAGADIDMKGLVTRLVARSGNPDALPGCLRAFLEANAANLRGFSPRSGAGWFAPYYRFVECRFDAGEPVFVLGFAESGFKPARNKPRFESFLKARRLIESDPELQSRFDANRDGVLDPGELEKAAAAIGMGMEMDGKGGAGEAAPPRVKMVFKKRESCPFIISNFRENRVIESLSRSSLAKICGGFLLTVLGAYALLKTVR